MAKVLILLMGVTLRKVFMMVNSIMQGQELTERGSASKLQVAESMGRPLRHGEAPAAWGGPCGTGTSPAPCMLASLG